jgi:hypothetical protein
MTLPIASHAYPLCTSLFPSTVCSGIIPGSNITVNCPSSCPNKSLTTTAAATTINYHHQHNRHHHLLFHCHGHGRIHLARALFHGHLHGHHHDYHHGHLHGHLHHD